MSDEQNNDSALLDNLLKHSPEELLRVLPNDMRYRLSPLLSALDLLEEKTLSEEERDEMLAIAKRSAVAINEMLNLILRYFKVREEAKNNDQTTN